MRKGKRRLSIRNVLLARCSDQGLGMSRSIGDSLAGSGMALQEDGCAGGCWGETGEVWGSPSAMGEMLRAGKLQPQLEHREETFPWEVPQVSEAFQSALRGAERHKNIQGN